MQRRILGLWKRLRSVLARWEAGTLRPVVSRQGSVGVEKVTPPPDPLPQGEGDSNGGGAFADAGESCPHPQQRDGRVAWAAETLLRRVGWLGRLMPRVERTVFLPLLNDPEMQAIFERAPQVGRILRP